MKYQSFIAAYCPDHFESHLATQSQNTYPRSVVRRGYTSNNSYMPKPKARKIGRSAETGQFKSVAWARTHKSTAVVEHVPIGKKSKRR